MGSTRPFTNCFKKEKSFRFLTQDLQDWGIRYCWGFPFRLIVAYQANKYILRSLLEAKNFHLRLKSENKAAGSPSRTGKV